MIESLESRQFLTVAVLGADAPDAGEGITAGGTSSSGESSSAIVVSNDLGPKNIQKKHVSSIPFATLR